MTRERPLFAPLPTVPSGFACVCAEALFQIGLNVTLPLEQMLADIVAEARSVQKFHEEIGGEDKPEGEIWIIP
jgi:hypothetical protein